MNLALAGSAAGGIGLFLLGMMLMTEGLKLAAGRALRHILRTWTRTPLRGLLSGVLITSLVQASGAVTVATIGFVNAGLLGLLETVYVILGSNIGTTMTGWLVALVGFKLDVKALALPLIALGMLLRLTGGGRRSGALGTALAGFGLFFLGIDVLKTTFEEVGKDFPIDTFAGGGLPGAVAYVGVGFILTFLMQSSSAAMVVTLTAAAGGLVGLADAAAVVIGANLGTTSTAALAVLGATPNAKRAAAAHVLFNLLTAVIALFLLVPLLTLITGGLATVGAGGDTATVLALFHTVFNILGVALIWRFTPALVRFLERHFRSAEEDLGRPRHLDRNVLTTPSLAVDALVQELQRIGHLGRGMVKGALSSENVPGVQLARDAAVLARLNEAVSRFTVEVQRANLPRDLVENLPNAIRVGRYYHGAADMAVQVAGTQQNLGPVEDGELCEVMAHFRSECVGLIDFADPERADYSAAEVQERLGAVEHHYQRLKALLLRAGAGGRLPVRRMVAQLDQYSAIRRMIEQTVKGAHYLCELRATAARLATPESSADPAKT